MAAKSKSGPKGEGMNFAAVETIDRLNAAFTGASERGRGLLEAGLEAWSHETQRYYDELSSQGAMVMEQLKACQSPVEVLGVEQAWLAARAKAYLESGLRFAQAFATVAQGQMGSTPPPGAAPGAPN